CTAKASAWRLIRYSLTHSTHRARRSHMVTAFARLSARGRSGTRSRSTTGVLPRGWINFRASLIAVLCSIWTPLKRAWVADAFESRGVFIAMFHRGLDGDRIGSGRGFLP